MTHYGGIDEAGRGPVLGPMVYTCLAIPKEKKEEFDEMDFDDSKKLTEEQRDRMYNDIVSLPYVEIQTDVIDARDISAQMLAPNRVSLNAIAFNSVRKILTGHRDAGVDLDTVWVDTVGTEEVYARFCSSILPNCRFIVEKKADAKFKVTGAASIVAKVTRDRIIQEYSEKMGVDVGSGYPGDARTKQYVVSTADPVFAHPDFVRHSWSTAKDYVEDHCHEVVWGGKKGQRGISGLMTNSRTSFFAERGLDFYKW